MTASNLRIAIASCGLGHVRRGIETWAEDLGSALLRRGMNVTLFKGGDLRTTSAATFIPCWKRFDARTGRLVRLLGKLGGWRYGFGSGYEVEQSTFALNLWPYIRSTYDILHVQDPWVGLIFEYLHRLHLSRPRVILAHGTEEEGSSLRKYSFLQHLAPNYLETWRADKPLQQKVFSIPNFVDIARFRPGDKIAARKRFALPEDAFIVLSVGALKRAHKRMDYLIQEFLGWHRVHNGRTFLVIAGAREPETDEVRKLAAQAPEAILLIEDAPRDDIADLLRAADVFTLASLHEMLPIAALEGLAAGLPIACNDTPTLRWLVGDAGRPADISKPGALAGQFHMLAVPEARARLSRAARERAEAVFSEQTVVDQTLAMYRDVVGTHDQIC